MVTSSRKQPLFSLGQVVGTPGALEALAETGQSPVELLTRHQLGDWGQLDEEDWAQNDESVKDGSRLLSAYHLQNGTKVWVITEAADEWGQRSATTILLPSEY
jgi:phosphoserine phosphatase